MRFQMRRRTRYSLLLMLALMVALVVVLVLRKAAPPEAARLLPESDAIVYANLKPLRLATHFERTQVTRSPDYQQFIDATGIDPERDLDSVAFALHRMDDPNGPNGPVGYSEVFEGRFDGDRLARYLATIATAKENYAGHDIFTVTPSSTGTAPRPPRLQARRCCRRGIAMCPRFRAHGRSATLAFPSPTAATSVSSDCSSRCLKTRPSSRACAFSAHCICASSRSLRPTPMRLTRPRR
jgi:hypothetical protein